MITALLLGRMGSLGFPGKNTIPVLGHPLAWYPIRTALAVNEIDKVWMGSTDEKSCCENNGGIWQNEGTCKEKRHV